jgi:membrane protease YdiL (CAAX protease family)
MPAWVASCFIGEQGSVRSGWKLLGFLLLCMVLGVVLGLGAKALHVPRPGVAFAAWINATVVALASFICVRLEKRSFRNLGFHLGPRWLGELVVGAAGGILLILAAALVVRSLHGFHWERSATISIPQVLGAAWLLLGVAVFEEMMARGFPFQRLVEGVGPWLGQLVLAGLFALAHWGNPGMHGWAKVWATVNIALAAILLGFCYLRTGSLAMPIGLHFGWNWTQGSLLGFGVSGTTDLKGIWTPVFHGRPDWLTGGSFGLEASLPCALICGAAILVVWRWKGTAHGIGNPKTTAST